MAKIKYITFGLSVEQNIDEDIVKRTLTMPLEFIILPFVPTTYSFAIITCITEFDVTQTHIVKMLLSFKDDKSVIYNTGDIIKPAEPDNPLRKKIPSQFVGFSLGVDMRNVIFQKEGIYVLSVYFDNEKIGERELYVVEDMQNE